MIGEPTVHIVDDDAAVRRAMVRLLRSAGFAAVAYESAQAILNAAPNLASGCILLDVRMPGMDGLELLAQLGGFGIDLPVIVLTGHGDVPTAVRAMKAGAVDFIEKPIVEDQLLGAIRAALDNGATEVLVLTIASAMSASHDAAAVAVRDVGERARVVDTMTAAGGQALVVLAAARAAADGASIDAVASAAADVAGRVRLVATVPNLEHLVRSGRVPGIAGWAGRTLGISPLFEFRTGRVHRLRPARGVDAAYDRLVARFRRESIPGYRPHVVALHALAPEAADSLLDRVRDVDPVEPFTSEFGSVMVVHAGPGLVGLAWWWEPVSPDG